MEIEIFGTPGELAEKAAGRVAGYVRTNPGRLLCLAAGETPLGMLRILTEMQGRGEVDLRSMSYVGLDEWAGLGPDDRGSCRQVMQDHFYGPAGIPAERLRAWDGLAADLEAECRAVEAWMRGRGGIGLSVLGVGMNGHVGFNEPDGPAGDGCHIVDLDETTRSVSVKYFGRPRPVTRGVTIGLAELGRSERLIIMVSGASKAGVVRKAFREEMTAAFPASLLRAHPALTVMLDRAAAAEIR